MIEGATLIAGPTASGKSTLAMDLARRRNGVVVNANSMQVYAVLRILTARPSDAEMAAVPHALYGHVDPTIAYSAGGWLRDVEKLAGEGAFAARPPIFVGGTGLYFKALLDGLSEMPAIPLEVRQSWRQRLLDEGPGSLHHLLQRTDPQAARSIRPSDSQRIVRALEVINWSGRSITEWRKDNRPPIIGRSSVHMIVIDPNRDILHRNIERRFDMMIAAGALDEAKAVSRLALSPTLPAAKAIGLRELSAALNGRSTLEKAVETAKARTRQYAKRQMTWFRNQFGPEWKSLKSPQLVDL